MTFVLIAGGLALLLGGGEILVRGAVALARSLGVSPLVIGLITTIAIALFVLLAIDEDPTALEGRERPYSVHVKAGPAGPGTHKK